MKATRAAVRQAKSLEDLTEQVARMEALLQVIAERVMGRNEVAAFVAGLFEQAFGLQEEPRVDEQDTALLEPVADATQAAPKKGR